MESKKVEFFNKLSFFTLLATFFISILFFIPYSPVTLEASKGFLISIGITLSIFFWFISRLGEGRFVVPKDKLILFAMAIPFVFLISSFFSSSLYVSLFGNGFEIGTFGSMLVLFILFFLSTVYFQTEKRLWYFIFSLFLAGLILVLFQLFDTLVGFNAILPGFLQGLQFGNLIGSWNNFALILGLMVLLSVFTLELLKTKTLFRVVQYILLSLSIFFLIIINFPLVWLLIGIFSVILFVYAISLQHSGTEIVKEGEKRFPFSSLIVVFISLIFLIGGNLASDVTSKYINFNNPDVRPSFMTTSRIAFESFKHNPLLGTGPNTFVNDWSLWQPKEISQTLFWNADFINGFSFLSTIAVTTGLLGLISFLIFLIIYITRSVQSIRIALRDKLSNYFIMTTLMISLYSWISIIIYNPNILILMLAFTSSGILIGILVYKQAILVKDFSFLSDPRNSFFSILILLVLMVSAISLTYIYVEKFTSIMYFSKSLNSQNTMESLSKSEGMLMRAISLDKNDIYYRNLSQIYLAKINLLIEDKNISEDILKSNLQELVNRAQQFAGLAISQNPKQYLNYVNLGNIYSSLSQLAVENSYQNALISYDEAFLLAPNNPSIILSKATLEYIQKNNTEARKYIDQALLIKPNYVDAIFLLVQIETNEGNLSEAIKKAEYAGVLSPTDPTVSFRIGLLKYNNNDFAGAVSAFEKAVILNNNYLNARFFLGQSYKKVGRSNDALVQFRLLQEIEPNNQEIINAINSIGSIKENNVNDDDNPAKPPLQEKQ